MSPQPEAQAIPTINVPRPLTSWDRSLHVDFKDFPKEENGLKAPGSPLESNGSVSLKTDLIDNGDEAQLRKCRPQSGGSQPTTSASKADLDRPPVGEVVHGMERDSDSEPLAQATGNSERDLLDFSGEHENIGAALASRIRAAFVSISDGDRENCFLPFDALERLITKNIISEVLKAEGRIPDLTANKLSRIVDDTWSMSEVQSQYAQIYPTNRHHESLEPSSSRRKLFAILACLERASDIAGFIEEGIYDIDLPFESTSVGEQIIITRQLEGAPKVINVFNRWGPDRWKGFEKDMFISQQWKMQAPFFPMQGRKCRNLILPDKVVLPFLEKKKVTAGGGFGEIRQVKIHPQHHDHEFGPDEPHYFAIKKLIYRENIYEMFRKEMANLKRVRNHPNIIKLMATYEWKGGYYFLFPWADGDLCKFWNEFPGGGLQKTEDPSTPRWLAGQFLALARGLEAIHLPDKRDERSLSPDRGEHGKYGRHGDFKPDNILWFKSKSGGFGHFKIADLGLSQFHRKVSLLDDPQEAGRTLTFRAPEVDTQYPLGPEYDMWTLGCVLLMQIGWYIHGSEHRKNFENNRIEDGKRAATRVETDSLVEDNFFTFETREEGGRAVQRATIKKSVIKELEDLKQNPSSSDLIIELLDVIQHHLLRMGPEKRMSIADAVKKFESLHKKCGDDPDYGLKRTMTPGRTCTGLSSLTNPSSVDLPVQRSRPPVVSRSSIEVWTGGLPSIDSVLPAPELGVRSSNQGHPVISRVPTVPRKDSSGLTAVESPVTADANHPRRDSTASSTTRSLKIHNAGSFQSGMTRVDDHNDMITATPPPQEADMLLPNGDKNSYGTNADEGQRMPSSSDDEGGCTCLSFSWLRFTKESC